MRKRFILSVVFLTLLIFPLWGYAAEYTYLFSFGDSLSDTGNLYAQNPTAVPDTIYYQGRFTNGQVWVEYLRSELGIDSAAHISLAFGGAVSSADGGAVSDSTKDIPDLSDQIDLLLMKFSGSEASLTGMFQSGLVTLWIGGNDITNSLKVVAGTAGWTTIVDYQTVADNVQAAIEKLIANNATDFLINLLPNVGATPVVKGEGDAAAPTTAEEIATATNEAKAAALATEWTIQYNQALKAAIDKIVANHPGAGLTFYVYDTNVLFSDAMANPAAYNLDKVDVTSANFKTAAFTTAYGAYWQAGGTWSATLEATIKSLTKLTFAQFEAQVTAIGSSPLYNQLANLQQGVYFANSDPVYLFWDGFHPTTEVHKVIAEKTAELIKNDTTYQAQAVPSTTQVFDERDDSCFIMNSIGSLLN